MDSMTNDGTQKCADSIVPLSSLKNTEESGKESPVMQSAPVENQQSAESAAEQSSGEEASLDQLAKDDDSEWEDITTDDGSESEDTSTDDSESEDSTDDSESEDSTDDSESEDITTDDELPNSPGTSNASSLNKSEPKNKSASRKLKAINYKETFGMDTEEILEELLGPKDKLMSILPDDKKASPLNKSEEENKSVSRKRKAINYKETFGVDPKEILEEILAEKDKLMSIVRDDKKVELLECYQDELKLVKETMEYFASEAAKILRSATKRYKKAIEKGRLT